MRSTGSARVSNSWVETLRLDEPKAHLGGAEVVGCAIGVLELPPDGMPASSLPTFRSCQIASVQGRLSERDLPEERFIDCEFEQFDDSAANTTAALSLSLPLPQRLALWVLKKLFVQRGRGRKVEALYRGLDQDGRSLVPAVLQVLAGHGFVFPAHSGNQALWIPRRGMRSRVASMMEGPTTCTDEAWLALKEIG